MSWPERAARILAVAVVGVGAAGCSSSAAPSSTGYRTRADAAPLPATTPYLVMTSRSSGWAVWRTGEVWVLLHTSDSFRHVTNRTPVAVPTEGGLVAAFSGDAVAVAVEASKRLLRSPVLTSSDAATAWRPHELPSAVFDSRDALASGFGSISVVTAQGRGSVVAEHGGKWTRVTDAAALAPNSTMRIDSLVWADRSTGWITGHGTSEGTTAFETRDGGATWTAMPSADQSVATLAPCGSGGHWLMPVIDTGGRMTLFRTADDGRTWTAGAALQVAAGLPAWGCSADEVWTVGGSGKADHLFASADSGVTWNDRGAVPPGLSDLEPTGSGTGVAISGGSHGHIWSVGEDGSRFTAVTLPSWVATLGAQMSGD